MKRIKTENIIAIASIFGVLGLFGAFALFDADTKWTAGIILLAAAVIGLVVLLVRKLGKVCRCKKKLQHR